MSSGPVTQLALEKVKVSIANLPDQDEVIHHHTGGAIIILEIGGVQYVLLGQRPENGRWGGSWEMFGGSYDEGDETIVDTAIRETKEESGFVFTREDVSKTVFRDTFKNPKYPDQNNASYYVVVKQKLERRPQIHRSEEHKEIRLISQKEFESLATCTDKEWTDEEGIKKIQRFKREGTDFMLLRKKQAIDGAFQAV